METFEVVSLQSVVLYFEDSRIGHDPVLQELEIILQNTADSFNCLMSVFKPRDYVKVDFRSSEGFRKWRPIEVHNGT